MRAVSILHAPSPLGLKPPFGRHVPGVHGAPDALQRLGLHRVLGAEWAGVVRPPAYHASRDPAIGVRNIKGLAAFTEDLADALGPLLSSEERFPLVLGGDCSIALGVARALSRSGRRYGLLYIDAHSDCQTPESSGTGGAAGMPLAMITGNALCPSAAGLERRVDIASPDAVLIGVRDLFDVEQYEDGRRVVNIGVRVHDLDEIRQSGAASVAAAALADLAGAGVDAAWIHLDVDVLDPRIMPAVDSPDPGGLDEAELTELLRMLLSSSLVRGMHVTIYDPERDPDGSAGRLLVRILAGAFGRCQE